MEQPKHYVLELDDRHLGVMCTALELLARIGIGQYGFMMELPGMWDLGDPNVRQAAKDMLDRVHVLLLDRPPNSGPGIGADSVHPSTKTAWDLYQTIRHRLSWDKNPKGGWTVNFDEPMHTNHQIPLIQIRKQ